MQVRIEGQLHGCKRSGPEATVKGKAESGKRKAETETVASLGGALLGALCKVRRRCARNQQPTTSNQQPDDDYFAGLGSAVPSVPWSFLGASFFGSTFGASTF